jgi:hypothetical protein
MGQRGDAVHTVLRSTEQTATMIEYFGLEDAELPTIVISDMRKADDKNNISVSRGTCAVLCARVRHGVLSPGLAVLMEGQRRDYTPGAAALREGTALHLATEAEGSPPCSARSSSRAS